MDSLTLHHWIVPLACAYMEYTTFAGRSYYRRTVDYRYIPWC
ncbi:hypothetical protein [Burkholderia gladioli]|jgi:hypothetical protein|nr:hypothetical protein [Burkholderia gladioli]